MSDGFDWISDEDRWVLRNPDQLGALFFYFMTLYKFSTIIFYSVSSLLISNRNIPYTFIPMTFINSNNHLPFILSGLLAKMLGNSKFCKSKSGNWMNCEYKEIENTNKNVLKCTQTSVSGS